MAALYLTPAEKYTAALGGFYYGDLPEPGTVYTQLIKDILDGSTPDKEPKNILARFIYSLYISDLGDPYPRYELAKLLYWKLHNITPTKSGSILTVTIDGKEDYMTINTDLSRLWYKVLFGSKTDVITEFPYTFNTMQNKLSDWELFGNVEASGTPTPNNPIMPQGTGERTGNLFDVNRLPSDTWTIDDKYYIDGTVGDNKSNIQPNTVDVSISNSGDLTVTARSYYGAGFVIPVTPDTTYTISFTTDMAVPRSKSIATITYVNADEDFLNLITIYGGTTSVTFTTPNTAYYILITLRYASNTITYSDIMLNLGSTPLPYEPYGYKLDIKSANTTTPVYLGEVQTTRKVKKLVLTGQENYTESTGWKGTNTSAYYIDATGIDSADGSKIATISSHFEGVSRSTANYNDIPCIASTSRFAIFRIETATASTAAEFKQWVAQQYANGTPVTVWYVLATPETAVVNEPLMKIGDYTDSMSRTQTGIDIPTVVGQNTLDVLTTVKPSSMRIEYTSSDENRSRSKRISLLKSPLKKRLIK